MFKHLFRDKAIVTYIDLFRAGLVNSRYSLWRLIEDGDLRPPYKRGDKTQSSAYWLPAEALADFERYYGKHAQGPLRLSAPDRQKPQGHEADPPRPKAGRKRKPVAIPQTISG